MRGDRKIQRVGLCRPVFNRRPFAVYPVGLSFLAYSVVFYEKNLSDCLLSFYTLVCESVNKLT